MADDMDRYELIVGEELGLKIEPLLDRLRMRTLTRAGHERLCALIVENALKHGQAEATAAVLMLIDDHWKRCPMRYLPPWKLRPAVTIVKVPDL